MNNRTDQNAVAVLGVKDDMRLKPKASESGSEKIRRLSDGGEVGEQAEGAL